MSQIGQVIDTLNRTANNADEVGDLLRRAQSDLDSIRDRMRLVLADSQAPEVARAHGVSAATADYLMQAQSALMMAGQHARHRAATL